MRSFLLITILSLLIASPAQGYQVADQALFNAIAVEAQTTSNQKPAVVEAIYAIQGVRPDHYLRRRLPQPEVARELKRITGAAPILMNLYLQGFGSFPFSPNGNYDSELRAMRLGVISAVGSSRHPLADSFLIHIAENESIDAKTADALFRALGQTETPSALLYLAQASRNEALPIPLRSSAIFGLGHHRTLDAATTLKEYLRHTDPVLKRSALGACATLGSAWSWKAKGEPRLGIDIRNLLASEIVAEISAGGEPALAAIDKRAKETLVIIGTEDTVRALKKLSQTAMPGGKVASFATASAHRLQRGLARRR